MVWERMNVHSTENCWNSEWDLVGHSRYHSLRGGAFHSGRFSLQCGDQMVTSLFSRHLRYLGCFPSSGIPVVPSQPSPALSIPPTDITHRGEALTVFSFWEQPI